MNVIAITHYLSLGYRVRRSSWQKEYISKTNTGTSSTYFGLEIEDLLADDWELVKENLVEDLPIRYEDK
jgi:hypothetical protein